jgi:preprotein translocase subunit YajC
MLLAGRGHSQTFSTLIECTFSNSIVLAADPGAGGALSQFLLLFAPLFAIWYFLVIRPQQQQRRKTQTMLSNLKTGDRVVTSGGIYGTIISFKNGIVQLQIANQVKVDLLRSAITGVVTEETSGEAKQDSAAKQQKK